MLVGVLRVDLAILDALTLKDKRRVVSRVKDRLSHRFNVSVAEVGDLDLRQRAVLGIALVTNERRFAESCLHKIVDALRRESGASLIDYDVEFL